MEHADTALFPALPSIRRAVKEIIGRQEWRAVVDALRTLPELRLVVLRFPEWKNTEL